MAYKLFKENPPNKPVRSLGVRACNLTLGDERQISFLPDLNKMQKHESLELAVDNIRRRFGHFSLQRGIMLLDKPLSNLDPKAEHTIFPVSFLK